MEAPFEDPVPLTFDKIFSYDAPSGTLHWVNLNTSIEGSTKLSPMPFRGCWCGLTDDTLMFAGGRVARPPDNASDEVWKIDFSRDLVVLELAHLLTPRAGHGLAYDGRRYAYAVGGCVIQGNQRICMDSAERYDSVLNAWEALPSLPTAVAGVCPTILRRELYAVGGTIDGTMTPFNIETDCTDVIQVFSLDSWTWRELQVRLSSKDYWLPCFIADDSLYTLVSSTVMKVEAEAVTEVTKVSHNCHCFGGPSYFRNSTLYCSSHEGQVTQLSLLLDQGLGQVTQLPLLLD
jgi:hypothetical protein